MKFIALFMIIVSGILFGINKYKDMEKRVRILEFYESLLNEIKIGVSCSLNDIHLIFGKVTAHPGRAPVRMVRRFAGYVFAANL